MPIKDVTAKCTALLKAVPYTRSLEGFKVAPDLPVDKLIPQADESIFLKLYVTEPILKDGKLDITSTDLFPNYAGRMRGEIGWPQSSRQLPSYRDVRVRCFEGTIVELRIEGGGNILSLSTQWRASMDSYIFWNMVAHLGEFVEQPRRVDSKHSLRSTYPVVLYSRLVVRLDREGTDVPRL